MAKQVHNEPTSSKTPLVMMGIGGVLVGALVVWAVTRSVEPAPSVMADTSTASVPTNSSGYSTTASPTPMPSPATGTGATGTAAIPPSSATQMPQTSTLSPLPDVVPPAGTLNAEASVARISAEDLRTQVGRGAVTVIDVRDAASYTQGHIPGALHIPFSRVEAELNNIPRNKPIVTYCT